jgi:hypothetical protein
MLDVEVKLKGYKPLQINVLNASQMILPPVASSLQGQNVAPWTTGIAYTYGTIVRNAGHYYWCIVAGTAGATAPVHHDGDASDGTVTWRYVRWQRRAVTLLNVAGTSCQIAIARGNPAEIGKGIVLYANGSHNEGFDAVWAYQGAWYAISDSVGGRMLSISEG